MKPGPVAKDPDTTLPQMRVWVEGAIIVDGWDSEKRAKVDQLRVDLAAIGLNLQEQPSSSQQQRRSWSGRRVSLLEAAAAIKDNPGIAFPIWVTKLWRCEPWTDAVQQQALAKGRVAIHRMVKEGLVVKRYNRTGVMVLYPPGHPDIPKLSAIPGQNNLMA